MGFGNGRFARLAPWKRWVILGLAFVLLVLVLPTLLLRTGIAYQQTWEVDRVSGSSRTQTPVFGVTVASTFEPSFVHACRKRRGEPAPPAEWITLSVQNPAGRLSRNSIHGELHNQIRALEELVTIFDLSEEETCRLAAEAITHLLDHDSDALEALFTAMLEQSMEDPSPSAVDPPDRFLAVGRAANAKAGLRANRVRAQPGSRCAGDT